MKNRKKIVTALAVALVVTFCGVNHLRENFALFSSLTLNEVEALSSCESQGGYLIENCTPCKGAKCYDKSGEHKAKDCTYILVLA